jgi:hypothetical protein
MTQTTYCTCFKLLIFCRFMRQKKIVYLITHKEWKDEINRRVCKILYRQCI